MSPQDIFGDLDLTIFPEIALLIFAITFLAIAVRTARRSSESMSAAAQLPLAEELPSE